MRHGWKKGEMRFSEATSGFLETDAVYRVLLLHGHFVPFTTATLSVSPGVLSTKRFTFSLESRFLSRKARLLGFGWFVLMACDSS
jgi:hypothetical protein